MISIAYSPPSLEAKVRVSTIFCIFGHPTPFQTVNYWRIIPPTRVSDPREKQNRKKEACNGRARSLLNPTVLDSRPPSHSDILTFKLRTRIHDPCPSLSTPGMQARPITSFPYIQHPHQPSQKQHRYAIHSPTA